MKRDSLYLNHILDAINKISEYIAVGRELFLTTSHWHDATIRQLEIIGEATKNLTTELREQYSDVPWRRIAGLRDVLIHNYMGVDLFAVWEITQVELPKLRLQIGEIIGDLEQGE